MKFNRIFAAAAIVMMAAGCAKEQGVSESGAPKIYAESSESLTKTSIDNADADQGGPVSVLWTPGDKLGVFTSDNSNVQYTLVGSNTVSAGSFTTTESVSGSINYAYYPYDALNAGKAATSLVGKVDWNQTMSADQIPCDYKWGELRGTDNSGNVKFRFNNLFSLVRFKIDATGTDLAGETLETVTLKVTRADGTIVPVTGEFTFNATDGTYSIGCTTSEYLNTTSNQLKTTWNKTLTGTISAFATVFPGVKSGDKLNFVIKTSGHQAIFSATAKVDFASGMYYTFPLTLANFSNIEIMQKAGTFTAVTYNVDGLPSIANPDGPGKNGTKDISAKLATSGWDIIGFQENFDYNSNLQSSMTSLYTFGTHRGSVGLSQVVGIVANTDGLNIATLNTCSFSNETYVQFTKSYGGLYDGANTCIKKGFRYYLVTMKDGVQFDVIVTHMNSGSSSDHIDARNVQLNDMATYINGLKDNKRPIIIIGDTNCRYNRDNFNDCFWSILDSEFTVNDPWVDYQWAGIYPTYGGKSLMVSDATGTNADTDIICSTTQNGEVVDKVIYINNPNANVQIAANSFLRDMDYEGLADHLPIVVEFTYYKK